MKIEIVSLSNINAGAATGIDVVNLAAGSRNNEERAELLSAVLAYEATILGAVSAEQKRCEAIITKLKDPDSSKQDAADEADKEAKARELEELQKQSEELDAKKAEIQSKIDALNGGK